MHIVYTDVVSAENQSLHVFVVVDVVVFFCLFCILCPTKECSISGNKTICMHSPTVF